MRKIVYGINISLDGCCDHAKFGGGDDIQDYFRKLIEDSDLVLYGRKTYELMVPFWPDMARTQSLNDAGNKFAKAFEEVERIVVSRTLPHVDDPRSTIIRDNLKEEILKLKMLPGKSISTGGVDLPAQLIKFGLVDEFHIVIHPVLVGEGRRLFYDMVLPENINLRLFQTKTLKSGCVVMHYKK
jgi:dihydrofolate reductase